MTTRTQDDLDRLYGACISPAYGEAQENRPQRSRLRLNTAASGEIDSHLRAPAGGGAWARQLNEELIHLWLIDRQGGVLLAIEEASPHGAPQVCFVLPEAAPRGGLYKLGHPAIVEGAPARIGGEIEYDFASDSLRLTNKSGRYGYMRSTEELEHAAKLFQDHGLAVIPTFKRAPGGLS